MHRKMQFKILLAIFATFPLQLVGQTQPSTAPATQEQFLRQLDRNERS